jgi:membrane associated rhomboid family serine protease
VIPLRDLNPTRIRPVVTLALIAVNVIVWIAFQQHDTAQEEIDFLYERAVIACEVTTGDPLTAAEANSGRCVSDDGPGDFADKNVYLAALTSLFLHGGVIHLFGNMWFLWVFGNNVEEAYGRIAYLALYLAAGLAATLGFIVFNAEDTTPLVGASGAVAGVLGSYAVLFPRHQVLSLVFVFFVPIPAMVFLAFWFFSQFAFNQPGVAWQAHVAGFIVGLGITALLRTPLTRRLRKIHAPLSY